MAVRASGVRSSGGLGLSRALVVSRLGPGQSYPPARSRPATRKETSSSASHQSQLAARILDVFPSLETDDESTYGIEFIAVYTI